jgi:hypothetical protein
MVIPNKIIQKKSRKQATASATWELAPKARVRGLKRSPRTPERTQRLAIERHGKTWQFARFFLGYQFDK